MPANPFSSKTESLAREAIHRIDPSLEELFLTVIRFLILNPDSASSPRGRKVAVGTPEYIQAIAKAFTDGRLPKSPQAPSTVPDDMVSIVLEHYFDVDHNDLDRIKTEHALSMGAENIVGDLLEQYLNSELEHRGWVWCSGSVVKAVDFLKPPLKTEDDWVALQVKNRDNSENSSSSAIRRNTTIKKWHRTFSRKVGSNWAAFPDEDARPSLSEQHFRDFAIAYLKGLRQFN